LKRRRKITEGIEKGVELREMEGVGCEGWIVEWVKKGEERRRGNW
jgi:hypothetical protein